MTTHHVTEETTDRDACIRCNHSRDHHQHFRKGSECVGTEAIFVRGNALSSLPCRCRKYTRGHLQVALAVVGTLVVVLDLCGHTYDAPQPGRTYKPRRPE